MSSIVSKNQQPLSELSENIDESNNNTQDREEFEGPGRVSSHVYLKPAHSAETLDEAVVLRRIKHRKRMNRVRTAVQALLSSPFAAHPEQVSVHEKRWVDDAFAAP
ncbi:hypothetical protein NMG60_11016347 [Bertholletia excelsa]